ncbi:hypothetical protein V8J82_07300 [Gymnodinialimonas sp. 2305UL16-5]|uniref:hypothetical protein n=1 Tax=Gymnodinialimonas mytili TaxID=3126503 RepID=UPI0030B505B6
MFGTRDIIGRDRVAALAAQSVANLVFDVADHEMSRHIAGGEHQFRYSQSATDNHH